ncbi:MAG: YitT family protein [Fervidobacterium sp.]
MKKIAEETKKDVYQKFWRIIFDYFLLTVGVLITAIGIVSFLIPKKIAAGGASGLAIILNKFFNLPVGVIMYGINILLFVIAFLIVGFDFSFKTIYCTFLLNFFVDFLDRYLVIPKYQGADYFLAVFFGDILTAFGMALTFTRNGSTGGTDILAKIMNKFFATPMGITILLFDLLIGLSAGIAYSTMIGMYSIMAIIINGVTIDFVLKQLESSAIVFVVSEKWEEIRKFVIYELRRGVTILPAIGGYTMVQRKLLYIVVGKRELGSIIRRIKEIDEKSFISVAETPFVIGEGFREKL